MSHATAALAVRIPDTVMKAVRGPLLAAAMVGCSSSAPVEPAEPQPIAPTPVSESASSDPVDYDAQAEAERLARVELVLTETDEERQHRIAQEDQARAERQTRSFGGIGTISLVGMDAMLAACGRG